MDLKQPDVSDAQLRENLYGLLGDIKGLYEAVTPGSWVAPTLSGTWVNYGSPADNTGYRKCGSRVEIRGQVKDGTINTTVFTLPSGFRPTAQKNFASVSNGAFAEIKIAADGTVTAVSGSTARFSLDCSFSTT